MRSKQLCFLKKWLLENNCPWSNNTFKQAFIIGNLDNIKWLLENECPYVNYCDRESFYYLDKHKNLEWLLQNNWPKN